MSTTIDLGKLRFNWVGEWASSTQYESNDLVRYGGDVFVYTYALKTSGNLTTNATYWALVQEGLSWKGEYAAGTAYKAHEVVHHANNAYVCILSEPSAGNAPPLATYWQLLATGIKFEGAYNNSTVYQKDDIVYYGANSYICIVNSAGGNLPTNATYWTTFSHGISWEGVYNNSTAYQKDDVVSYGANVYISKMDNVGQLPIDTAKWDTLTSGIKYTAGWDTTKADYKINDVATFGGNAYISKANNPTAGSNPSVNTTHWDVLSSGIDWMGAWAIGTAYQKDDVVSYGSNTFIARITNTGHNPATVVASWERMTAGIEFIGVWAIGTNYTKDDIVSYGASTYIALADTVGHNPATVAAKWQGLAAGVQFIGVWANGTAYVKGDIVSYGSNTFVALGNTTGDNPVTITAKWQPFSVGLEFIGVWATGTAYTKNDIVTYGANSYIAKIDTTGHIPNIVTASWARMNAGIRHIGDWATSTAYLLDDVVTYGGQTFKTLVSHSSGAFATDLAASKWVKFSGGLDWKGIWATSTAYKVNDLVNSGGSVYIAVTDHTSGNFGSDSAKWASFANSGTDVALVITAQGDLLFRGASIPERLAAGADGQILQSGGAAANPKYLAQGSTGQLLTSGGAAADPTWETPATAAGFTIAAQLMYAQETKMTEQVKVFKNTGGTAVVPADMNAAIDYTLYTTTASQRAVIKDVTFTLGNSGKKRVTPLLDLDGYTAATGVQGSLSVEGSLIMGPSSTLKIKATPVSGYVGTENYFKGMFFTEGGSGMQFLSGDGSTATSIVPTKKTGTGHPCDDATAAIVYGTLHGGAATGTRFYYKLYNNNIKKYNEAGTQVHSWTYGSTGYAMCNDGTYIYRCANGSTTTIYRTKMSDQSETTIYTTGGSYNAPQANQGAGFHHHKGYLYSSQEGNSQYLDKIRLSDMNVTRTNSGDFQTGSYSDGGFTTTAADGTNYVVEAGDNYWWYYNIDTDTVIRGAGGGTSSSTEYAQGGAEIAPGIGIIFGEQTDRATLINVNDKSFVTTTGSGTHGYTTDYSYGNRFGFAGILGSVSDASLKDFNYSAFVSGVEIIQETKMTEQVKVFKNVNTVTPSAGELAGSTALDITIVTTTASQRAVIKDVEFVVLGKGKSRSIPTLDLDGFSKETGTAGSLSVTGNLIVGPSSTLKIKANTTADAGYAGGFTGMFFAEGSTGMQYLVGNGVTSSITKTQRTGSNHACDDAVAATVGSTVYYYKLYNNLITKYNAAGNSQHSWTYGSTGYGMCTDGTYIYRSANGSTSTIYRTKLSDQSETTLTTTTAYNAPGSNTGSIFVYHDGKIYSRDAGSSGYLDIIDIATLGVVRKSSGSFSLGSYSDGGCVVTTTAGKSYVVEQGTNYWYYYDIAADVVTRVTGASNGSTEYAQGGTEIAAGIALIFSELSDQCSLINMNTSPPTWSFGTSTPYVTTANFGNRFGFAGNLKTNTEFTYSAFATGIEITQRFKLWL